MIQSILVGVLFITACWFIGKSVYNSWFGTKDACAGCPMAKMHQVDLPK